MFRSEICDLYTAPRLSEPVWLNMMSYSSYRYVLCEQFMAEFMSLVSKYENKNTRLWVFSNEFWLIYFFAFDFGNNDRTVQRPPLSNMITSGWNLAKNFSRPIDLLALFNILH